MNNLEKANSNLSSLWGILTALGIGIVIGYLVFPSKTIEEEYRLKTEEAIQSNKQVYEKKISELEENLTKTSGSLSQYKEETEKKISKLTVENKNLKSSQKTSYYKLIKPDGTIEIKKFSESQVDESTKVVQSIQEEFKQKIESVEKKWEDIHRKRVEKLATEFSSKEQEYKTRISELEQKTVTTINPKKFGVEAGLLLNRSYFGHVTYDFLGPIFVGAQAQIGTSNTMGLGVGVRF